jgi:MFS family permease
MAQLDLFIVNVAVPSMGRSFGGAAAGPASLSSLSWVLNAYAIVFAALLVPAGRLADHFGRRRFLLAGVAVFTAASVMCALAPVLWVLVAGRVIQAAGAAVSPPGCSSPSCSCRTCGTTARCGRAWPSRPARSPRRCSP